MNDNAVPKIPRSLTIATVFITLFLLAYVCFLIKTNYDSQRSLQQTIVRQFKFENERQAAALGNFLADCEADLMNLADSRAIEVFFENRALGMSMAYGLAQSLPPIKERFQALLERSKINNKPIYLEMMFVDENGNVLTGVHLSQDRPYIPANLMKLLDPLQKKPAIRIKERGKEIIVSMAYYFKGKYSGQIVAWLSPEFLQSQISSSERISYIADDKETIVRSRAIGMLPDIQIFKSDVPLEFRLEDRAGERQDMIGIKTRIYETPFFLVTIAPKQNLLSGLRPKELPVGMGILAFLITGGAIFTYRLHLKSLLLQTRLAESNLYEKEILEKNRRLEEEISERIRAENERSLAKAELRGSEERFRELADSLPQTVFESDEGGNFSYLNSTALDVLGITPEKFENGVNLIQILAPEDRERATEDMHARLSGKIVGYREYTALRKDGSAFPAILIANPITSDGRVVGLRGVLTDISEHKLLEAELLKSQKLESIGILAGGIAHDFNNILTGILGNISLSKMALTPDNIIFARLEQAEEASLQASALTRQLLTFSKGGAPIKKTISPVPLIKDFSTLALSGTNVKIEFNIKDLWPIDADEGQLGQVLNNLIINACQSMPSGGIIGISAENVFVEGGNEFPVKKGRYVKIAVSDHGYGIPKERLQKIFDPYFTTKENGSGLGLAVVYSIISNHEGHIDVESTLGVGSTFTFYIPASEKAAVEEEAEEAGFCSGKGTVLVMDDEEFIRTVVGAMLQPLGYDVFFAKDGAEAIEIYRKNAESGHVLDAVIMDLTIPGGMGGKEAVREILNIDPHAKVIVSSGYSNDPIMSDFQKYGFSGVILKPYNVETLSKTLQQVITNSL